LEYISIYRTGGRTELAGCSANGTVWIFGGIGLGFQSPGYLSDLWIYNLFANNSGVTILKPVPRTQPSTTSIFYSRTSPSPSTYSAEQNTGSVQGIKGVISTFSVAESRSGPLLGAVVGGVVGGLGLVIIVGYFHHCVITPAA